MRRNLFAKIAFALVVSYAGWCLLTSDAEQATFADAATIEPDALPLVFDENFDALDVSAWGPGTRWIAHTPWNGDFGDAQFTDPGKDFPFTTREGILRIEARKDEHGKWRSGLLSTTDPKGNGFKQKYGYFEMRARLPPGKGVWPAFWITSSGKEKSVEIDVMEYYGQFPDGYNATLHIWDLKNSAGNKAYGHPIKVPAGSLTGDFHTYGVAVKPDLTRFFLDRRQVWAIATPTELQEPLNVMLDLGLGSGWPIDETPNPSIMEVDYVRVWGFPDK